MRWAQKSIFSRLKTLQQCNCRGDQRLIGTISEKPLEYNARVEHPFHGRLLVRLRAISLALRTGALRRRARMASTALTLACLRRARSTASRIKSAMTALLFTSKNVALNASLTSSGTLKLTVAIDDFFRTGC